MSRGRAEGVHTSVEPDGHAMDDLWFAARIRDAPARTRNVEEEKMFGGVGFLLRGNMLVGVWKDPLTARIGPDAYADALLEPHVREFDITGRAMKGWVLTEPEGVEGDDRLTDWLRRAEAFVGTLPVGRRTRRE